MVGVLSYGRGLFERETVLGASTSYRTFYRLAPHHLVMSQLFGWEGALALSGEGFAGKFVSPQFPTFRVIDERLDRAFLGWWLQRPSVWEQLKQRAKGMGDRRRTLNPEALLGLKISLPAVEEQRSVVGKIEAIATRVAEARRLRQEIQDDAKALLHSVFHRLIQGAEYRTLAEVAPIVRRPVQIDLDGAYSELGVRSFGKGTFHKPLLAGADVGAKKLYHIHPGDLVLSNVFAWEGAIAVARSEDKGRVGSHRFITCVPPPDAATADFLCFYLLTGEGMEQVREASPGGAGRNRTLGLTKLERVRVPVPGIDRQREFSALQAKVAAIHQAQAANQAELDALLPAVLDRAFKGEL